MYSFKKIPDYIWTIVLMKENQENHKLIQLRWKILNLSVNSGTEHYPCYAHCACFLFNTYYLGILSKESDETGKGDQESNKNN